MTGFFALQASTDDKKKWKSIAVTGWFERFRLFYFKTNYNLKFKTPNQLEIQDCKYYPFWLALKNINSTFQNVSLLSWWNKSIRSDCTVSGVTLLGLLCQPIQQNNAPLNMIRCRKIQRLWVPTDSENVQTLRLQKKKCSAHRSWNPEWLWSKSLAWQESSRCFQPCRLWLQEWNFGW